MAITVKDILAKKAKTNKEPKTVKLYIDSIDAEITIQEPDRNVLQNMIKKATDGDKDADAYAVLECCIQPNLRQELKGMGKSYVDAVYDVFSYQEIVLISGEIFKLSEFGKGVRKLDDEVGN